MALLAHYKLDENANDSIGGYNGALSGSYSTGRIGSAIAITSNQSITFISKKAPITLTGWFKLGVNSDDIDGTVVGLQQDTTNNIYLGVYGTGNAPFMDSNGYVSYHDHYTYNYLATTWYFYVMSITPNSSTITVYNSTGQVTQKSRGDALYSSYTFNKLYLGNAGGTCYHDDVRIYDHILSLKEIKELVKCKVLHYTFDKLEEYTTNLIPDGNFSTKTLQGPYTAANGGTLTFLDGAGVDGSNALVHTVVTGADSYTNYCTTASAVLGNVIEGEKYTASIYARSATSTNAAGQIYIFSLNSAYAYASGLTSSSFTITPKWQRFTVTYTIPTGTGALYLAARVDCDTNGAIIHWSNWQLEKKDHATPFVNGTRNDIITDSSGYGNNGVLDVNCPVWKSDGKIGSGNTYYNGSQFFPFALTISNPFSISCWIKTSGTGEQHFIASNDAWSNGRYRFYLSSGSLVFAEYDVNISSGATTFNNNVWHHVMISYDGTTAYLYADGALVISAAKVFSITSTMSAIGRLYVGAADIRYFTGDIDDVRIYLSSLTLADAEELSQTRASIDNSGSFFVQEIKEHNYYDPFIKSNNLVINGSQQLASNNNFSWATYNAGGYLTLAGNTSTRMSDTFIPVNPNHVYAGEGEIKSEVASSQLYFGFACYDKDYNFIERQMCTHFVNTETTLAVDLINGATTITVTSGANWKTSADAASYRYVGIWGVQSVYPSYTYTRNYLQYSNIVGNLITLSSAWTGSTVVAGTPVANNWASGAYNYKYASGVITNLTWTKYGGSNYTSTGNIVNDEGNFRFGTAYIKLLFLINYNNVAGSIFNGRNFKFWNLTTNQVVYSSNDKNDLTTSGVIECSEVNEIGPTKGLVAWYDFDDLPQIPDGAVTYKQGDATTDTWSGWAASQGTMAVTSGTARLTKTSTTWNWARLYLTVAAGTAKFYRLKVTALQALTGLSLYATVDGIIDTAIKHMGAAAIGQTFIINNYMAGNVSYVHVNAQVAAITTVGALYDLSWIYIGDGSYTTKATDLTINKKDMLFNNVLPLPGKVNNGLYFSSDYVCYSSLTLDYFRMDKFSFSLWIKTSGLGSGQTLSGLVSITYGVRLYIDSSGRAGFSTWNINLNNVVQPSGNLYDNLWHHIVATFDGSIKKLYIDNVLVATSGVSTNRWNWTNGFYIGVDANDVNTYRYQGMMDDVRIYNRDLTVGEVDTLNKIVPYKTSMINDGTVLAYKLVES